MLPPSQLDTIIRCGTLEKVAMEAPCNFNFLTLPFVPLRSRAFFLLWTELFWKLSGIWDYNHISQVSCYIRNCSLLAAISDWFSIVNLQLHLTIKPFQWTLMWFPKLPLESYVNWNYMQLNSEVLLACVVCCNCRCTGCWWRIGEVFLCVRCPVNCRCRY